MLKPSRSPVKSPNIPFTFLNEPANQKKYTSHTASPNANSTLSPATDRRPLRMVASLMKSRPLTYPTFRPAVEGLDFVFPPERRDCARLVPPALIKGPNGRFLHVGHDDASGQPPRSLR